MQSICVCERERERERERREREEKEREGERESKEEEGKGRGERAAADEAMAKGRLRCVLCVWSSPRFSTVVETPTKLVYHRGIAHC
jgi:hypothetical protein